MHSYDPKCIKQSKIKLVCYTHAGENPNRVQHLEITSIFNAQNVPYTLFEELMNTFRFQYYDKIQKLPVESWICIKFRQHDGNHCFYEWDSYKVVDKHKNEFYRLH